MAIQDEIMTAKQQAQSSIPIYVVPDQPGGQRPAYGDELVGRTGPGVYQYGNMGKSVYAPFAPGTKTLAAKQFDETKRANAVSEALAAQKAAKSSSGSAKTKEPTKTETLDAIRAGAISYAQGLVQGTPFTATRGLNKGKTYLESGTTPEEAAAQTVKLLNSQLGEMNLSNANYTDVVKQVYRSLGIEPPKNSEAEEDPLAALRSELGL